MALRVQKLMADQLVTGLILHRLWCSLVTNIPTGLCALASCRCLACAEGRRRDARESPMTTSSALFSRPDLTGFLLKIRVFRGRDGPLTAATAAYVSVCMSCSLTRSDQSPASPSPSFSSPGLAIGLVLMQQLFHSSNTAV